MRLLVFLLMAGIHLGFAKTPWEKLTGFRVLSSKGKYVFGQISENHSDQYMLDTETGRLWQYIETIDGGMLVVVPYQTAAGLTVGPDKIDLSTLISFTSPKEQKPIPSALRKEKEESAPPSAPEKIEKK
ncbi:hypothetical protein ACFL5V_02950 [Fibrobacterota bacterium]